MGILVLLNRFFLCGGGTEKGSDNIASSNWCSNCNRCSVSAEDFSTCQNRYALEVKVIDFS